jgi:hypothetical protein
MLGGMVLFVISAFLDWVTGASGWDALGFELHKLIWFIALFGIIMLVGEMTGQNFLGRLGLSSNAFGTIMFVAGLFSTLFTIFKIIDYDHREFGIFLALIGSAAWAYGGFLLFREGGAVRAGGGASTPAGSTRVQ